MTELMSHRGILAATAGALICVSGFAQAAGILDVGTTGVQNDPNVSLIDRGDGSYALVFTNAQTTTFTFKNQFVVTEALIVGGGGAGGGNCGGGGGAGGFIHLENLEVGVGIGEAISVTVGAGGTVPSKNAHGGDGEDSVLTVGGSDYRALGGGGGGTWDSKNGNAGGSGGGGINDGGATTQAASGMGVGFAGAEGNRDNKGGGGGGAGGEGLKPMDDHCGDGGPGVSCSITGTSVIYAAGGGGASRGVNPGAGGSDGVGGKGGCLGVSTEHGNGCGYPGRPGTGSGGGGSASDSAGFGGDGGSGIVVLVIRPDTSMALAVLPHGEPGVNYFKLDLTPTSDGDDGTGAVTLRGGWSLDVTAIPDNEIAASVPVLTGYPLTVTGLVSGGTYYYSFYSQNSKGEKSKVVTGQIVLTSAAAGGEPGVGGTVTKLANGDAVHVFTESGTLVLSEDYGSARVLIVGGGGSGGGNCGGGGGAGGFVELADINLTAGSYAVTVGAGGVMTTQKAMGVNGGDSTLTVGDVVYRAVGGGGGASWNNSGAVTGLSGGSGGGSLKTSGGASVQAEKGYGLGNVGGSSTAGNFGGGGGGAGDAGGEASGSVGGVGGPGKSSDITGEPVVYAAGGGGAGSGTPGEGGSGIGGNGGGQSDTSQGGKGYGYPGRDGTGSGGGGSAGGSGIGGIGGAGGSGVVIVRYHYAKDVSDQPEPSVSFGLGTLDGGVVTIPYTITWPGKDKLSCSAKILYGFAADDLRYEQNLGSNKIGAEAAMLGDLIPGRHYYLKLIVSNGDYAVESNVMEFDVSSAAPAPSAYPAGMPVIAGDGSGCVTIAGENVTFAGTFAQYVEWTVVKFHYLDDETWREVTATSVGADGFSGSFTIMTVGARYPYCYLTAEAPTGIDRTARKSFIVGGSVTLAKSLSVASPNCEITVTGSLEHYEIEDSVTVVLMVRINDVWRACGSKDLQQAGSFAITYDGTGTLVCGVSYDAKLTLANQESDIASFMVPDTLAYTWRNRDGERSWEDPDNWEPSDPNVLGAGYPVLGSTARFASGTATVENASVSIAKLSLADGAAVRLVGASTSLALGSAKVESGRATLLFEIPEKGYAQTPIRNLADAPKFNAEGGSLALVVDRASPFFSRHLTAWRTQTLVDWSTGLNTSALSFDRGDVTAMGGEKANALVRPMATADSVRKIAVELRGSAPTVVALSKDTRVDEPGEEEEDVPSWTDDPTPDEELSWSEASATAAKKYNTCVVLATSDDAAAGLWRTRLNEAGVAVARVKGDFAGEKAGAAGQRAVRVARSAANAGLHGLSSGAKIGAVGIEEGARLALLMALSSKDTFYTPKDATDALSCKLDVAGVVSPCDCIDGGVGNIVLNDKDEPTVDGVYANLAPEFKFDGDKCPIATISGDRQFVDPKSTYWTASLIYRRIRERTATGKSLPGHLMAQAHFYGAKEKPGNRVERMLEFMKSAGALGSMGTKTSASSLYPGGERNPVYYDPDKYEKTYLWDVANGISPIDPETGKPYPFTDSQKIPYIEWYVPTNLTTRAIQIIYSGGSYGSSLPGGSEVKPARICLNMHGMTVVTLHYRATGNSTNGYIRAQQDLQRAIRMVRAKAPSLGLDPGRIGIMGSSAGGHMTLYHATKSLTSAYGRLDAIDDYPATIKWAIPVYPAYTVGGGSYDGEDENGVWSVRSANRFLYDEATPAFLFMHGDRDLWPAGGTVKVWEALHRHGFEAELHTFAESNHCFQDDIYPGTSAYHYMDIVWEFLTTHKFNIW